MGLDLLLRGVGSVLRSRRKMQAYEDSSPKPHRDCLRARAPLILEAKLQEGEEMPQEDDEDDDFDADFHGA